MALDGISSAIGSIGTALPTRPVAAPAGSPDTGFGDSLQQLLGKVDGAAGDANQAVGRMLDGSGDVHEAMIAMQRADTMLQMTVQIRNKLVQAYQDIMRMPV